MTDPIDSIRRAEIEDAAALAKLTGQLGYPSDEAQMRSRLPLILGSRDRETVVAERSGRVVGYAGAWCGQGYEADAPHARVLVIVVDGGVRRGGIATRLMEAIEAWAQERGAGYIVLGSGHHRDGAHTFYERLGYRATGRRYKKHFGPS